MANNAKFDFFTVCSYKHSLYFVDNFIMEKDFECIKIKDGLYIGNKIVAMVPSHPFRISSF